MLVNLSNNASTANLATKKPRSGRNNSAQGVACDINRKNLVLAGFLPETYKS